MDNEQIKTYLRILYHRCLKILQNQDWAWDATQEIMTRYTENARRTEIREPLYYLYRASTNHCIDLLAEAKKTIPVSSSFLESLGSQNTRAAEGRLIVERLIARFGKDEIALLLHRYVDQMTYKEIATLYGKSDRGIKFKIERLEQQVQKFLNR